MDRQCKDIMLCTPEATVVVRSGSFTEAAEACHTQSAMSQQVKALE